MPLTQTEFEEACRQTCSHCMKGNVPRFRPETSEWTHDYTERSSFSHAYCQATGLRKMYEAGELNG